MTVGVGLLVFIFAGYSASRQLTLAADSAMDLTTALHLVVLNTLTTLDILLPSALFFSILAGLGRLYQDAEMPALLATGYSPWRVLWAVFKLAIFVGALVSVLSIIVRPWLYGEIYRLESRAEMQLDEGSLPTGGFVHIEDLEYDFIAGSLDEASKRYHDVFLYRLQEEGKKTEIIHAESAYLPDFDAQDSRNVIFYNAYQYLLDHDATEDVAIKTATSSILPAEREARRENRRRKATDTHTLAASDSLKDIAEYQWRLSAPVASILLALIAVPLARVWPRESRSRNTFGAIVIYVAVFSFTTAVRTWLEQGSIPSSPGLWLSYLLPALILIVLLLRKQWLKL